VAKRQKKFHATVQRIIKSVDPDVPEKAQIEIKDGEELYREIRVVNEITDDDGSSATFKPGAEVDVIVEADSNATMKKPA
jgi:hypothetical protein